MHLSISFLLRGWKRRRRLTAALAFVVFCGVTEMQMVHVLSQPFDDSHVPLSSLEHQTFDLINQYRAGESLPPLVWDPGIATMARRHSRDMATGEVDFGHSGFSDRMSALRSSFPGMRGGAENVFYSDDRIEVAHCAVQGWLNSSGHLRNIRGDFRFSGLGICRRSDGAYFFTQIFVRIGQ